MADRSRPKIGDVPVRVRGRHAFGHERVLVLIARETERAGSAFLSKREIAERLSLNQRTIDRSISRLRADGLVTSSPRHNAAGAQMGNEYIATKLGMQLAQRLAEPERIPRG